MAKITCSIRVRDEK